ncbi:UDP-N-acetylmuramoyl-L-alanyl-D-glutamate--2,6-diaminopimelate ligase [Rhizobium sp. TH2]|uniref:UDP-N-acetylmuramoyl-L-alanyl-D-glutamate--2, 6-diaminopimelate ligase n=1 Tax=Rhizobium sp. TH2 TaxID=2775403 RepID=UPI002157FFEF|nr:UDP-N-acetylmuramoyl-L-alanyl-D-glutamate--2,6-diaminopimelate ligase [Rhizobium sp. TH2]UVC06879.1 UDP-N-acetylmuramoyl-L-alanyl-D-glutamate--2,6-diaminopimelate ligase [Rhizobium sp. TH2]
MKLGDVMGGAYAGVAAQAEGIEISGISSDSRSVKPGDLFFALAGTKADGATYAQDAMARGAAAVVTGLSTAISDAAVPVLKVDDPRRLLAISAANLFHAQPKTMVAVTGTAGKTSVASFVRQIWAQAGLAAAQIGTTGVIAPGRNDYGSLTTPDPVTLHRLLADLANEGVSHGAMEASSHGLDQRRLDGVRLAAGAFTNLGRDHMDYHPTVEHYFQSKMRLFDTLLPNGAPAIVYSDDEWSGKAITAAKSASLDVCTVGRKGDFLSLKRVEHFRDKQVAEIHHGGEIFEVHLPLAGDFQIANAIVSAGLAIVTGVPAAKALQALHHIHGAPGRLELVGHTKDGALCYVDYAHKPDALEKVLTSVRPFTTGRVVVVFGCGGDRDKGKRPIMGEVATRLADVTIVTDDNPRSEVPSQIRSEIMAAAKGAVEIGDRADAIRRAVHMLGAGDTLIVAGKGHEEGQIIGDKVLPFSDHEEIRKALAA